MKINKTICIQGAIFLCCAVLGFAITHTMTSDNQQEIAQAGGSGHGASGQDKPESKPAPTPKPDTTKVAETPAPTPDPTTTPEVNAPKTPNVEKPEPQPVQMTLAEVSRILNSGSHDLDGVVVNVQNPAENENSTVSVSMIRSYLKTGVWSSVSAVSLVPGPKGKPSSVTIRVVHNED